MSEEENIDCTFFMYNKDERIGKSHSEYSFKSGSTNLHVSSGHIGETFSDYEDVVCLTAFADDASVKIVLTIDNAKELMKQIVDEVEYLESDFS